MLVKASGCASAVKILSLCLTWLILFSILEVQMYRSECFLRKQAYIIRIILPQVQFSQISLKRPIVYTLLFFSARTNSRNLLISQFYSSSRFLVNIFLMSRGCSRMKENTAFMQFFGMFFVSSLQLYCLRLSSSAGLERQGLGFSSLLGFIMLSMSMQLSLFPIASEPHPFLPELSSSMVTVSPCSWLSGQLTISQQFQGQRLANSESRRAQNSLVFLSVGCRRVYNAFLEANVVFLSWAIF